MKIDAKLGVDAGNICVLDEALIRENGGIPTSRSDLGVRISVEPGKYEVILKVAESYRDLVVVRGIIEVKGTALVIGDACYHWSDPIPHETWMAFLEKTSDTRNKGDYLKNFFNRGLCLDTGGDGEFMVTCTIEPV